MLDNIEFHFTYLKAGTNQTVIFKDGFEDATVKTELIFDNTGNSEKLRLTITPKEEIEIVELYGRLNFKFLSEDKIFANGYQSWTDSREFFIDEKIKGISKLVKPIANKYQLDKYGDYNFMKYTNKAGVFHGYTYSYVRRGEAFKLIGSLSERNGYTVIAEDASENSITIEKDCAGHFISEAYLAYELVWLEGAETEVFDRYFELMDIVKPIAKPMTGWTSWYNYYQNINEAIILENLNNFKSLDKNINIFQIDDGYQRAVGDWLSIDEEKFPRGLKFISDKIKSNKYLAGLWLAPFVCETNSRLFREKKAWILKDDKGQMISGGCNWSKFYALDFYNAEVRQYIKQVFDMVLREWNFDLVKLDFLYAVCLIPRKDKTRGQIMTEAMEFLRECAGDKLILGCGVPLGPAFGLVDYCRIGCDVGLDWDDKPHMKLLHRERVSTLNAISNAIGRRQLNGRAFMNDPDVFLLREENIELTGVQKNTLATVNSIFGSLLFTSDNIKEYDIDKHLLFDEIIGQRNRKVKRVQYNRNGLVEVEFVEEEKKYMAFINLSKKYINHFYGKAIRIEPYGTCVEEIE